jgi:hypothetical protein
VAARRRHFENVAAQGLKVLDGFDCNLQLVRNNMGLDLEMRRSKGAELYFSQPRHDVITHALYNSTMPALACLRNTFSVCRDSWYTCNVIYFTQYFLCTNEI